jgi:hypothetical protein
MTAAPTVQVRMGEAFGIDLVLCHSLYRCVVFKYPTFSPLGPCGLIATIPKNSE